MTDWVFGYGSLVLDFERLPPRERADAGHVAELPGYRRCWGVAMDNRERVPGYKIYLDDQDSQAPVSVAFLDVVPDADRGVNGVLAPVGAAQLDALDRRERNYDRVDVTTLIDGPDGRIFTYMGSPSGRERLATAKRDGTAVIQRDYLDEVRHGFAALGPDELARFEASTDPAILPVLDLRRVDLPGEAPSA